MTANGNRASTYTAASGASDGRNGERKDLWSSLLDSVASGKRLPEKNIIVLGGSSESQRDFLESLSNGSEKRSLDRQSSRAPPVANSFALGYTYYDVLDADHEDILARISLYMLSNPSEAFPALLEPLLTPESIPNTLLVILLDWSTPHLWMRQLRKWILFMRNVLEKTSRESQAVMEEVMVSWRDRGRGGSSVNLDGTATGATGEDDVSLPLGPGEWEEALGLPLCVVCQRAEKIELLEKSQGWKEGDFDQVLQYLRTTLLRHGASLIYTTPNVPSPLPSLVHSSLGVTSLLKRQPLKHNVIDRDKILVPPNWDSWGKIRVLRDGFDVEATSIGWSRDLQSEFTDPAMTTEGLNVLAKAKADGSYQGETWSSAIAPYEDWIRDLTTASEALALGADDADSASRLEVQSDEAQDFLSSSLAALDAYKVKAEQKSDPTKGARSATPPSSSSSAALDHGTARHPLTTASDGKVSDHIGPVQFNMGGIQVDADDMVQRLKDRQAYTAAIPDRAASGSPGAGAGAGDGAAESGDVIDTENLQAFFSGLMNRKTAGAGGAAGSVGTPRASAS
ncbi:dynein light intermediate chain [Sodiomyces alkalinus F11]|uniref:Dynein light intermediate chain n=1 Tax=Sodiomyces alkalinus (strain CBS 110278 / VKM F-3762 / F11) TaxID=1314773 RepID=A0A3N2Q2T5_SODAK|nr:dynein light intermediate chain [Sodiomyces alkalinus F11]ROT41037.1 dynein light intermediate chain [Sodiomyces alkalinus F11]